jgi:predicted dehydrogenase
MIGERAGAAAQQTLRVGIIGAARVATYAMIAPARANPRVKVTAIAARDAATHGIARVHDSYAALAADPDIDLVYVATPPRFHAEHARLAIAAGKPVLVEKPFTMNAAEAEALLADARAAGVAIFEAMHARHRPVWGLIASLLPQIGTLRHLDAVFDIAVSTAENEFRWQDALGGGALMDLGVYPLAWVRAIAGEPLDVEAATMRRQRGADAAFSATLLLAGGATASVAADMTAPRRAPLTISGSSGRIILANAMAQAAGQFLDVETAAGQVAHPLDGPSTFDAQLAAVAATLIDGAPFPLGAGDPLASMQAIDMVRARVRAGAR